MTRPLILPLSQCREVDLTGGKAVGLARLIAAGFSVPQGFCVTTEAYRQCLQASGFHEDEQWHRVCALSENERASALADCRNRIKQVETSQLAVQWRTALHNLSRPPDERWAVRSSATNEDTDQTSFAGLYRSHLGVAFSEIDTALKDLWASLWEEGVVSYITHRTCRTAPRMAVVIQPMVHAQTAGVAYSIHPVTGRSNHVTINAVPGLAAPLVDGTVKPDQYVVEVSHEGRPIRVRTRVLAEKSRRLVISTAGLRTEFLDEATHPHSSLADEQLFSLAHTAKRIERTFARPMDLEWVFDDRQLWIVQARPITTAHPSSHLTNDDCEWSRTNFKETLPEIPSPLGLSLLEHFMEAYILSHYRRLGCHIPPGLSSVRVLEGRPYLNITLFHNLSVQLHAEAGLNSEQVGGESPVHPPPVAPLSTPAILRAGWLMWREMRRCEVEGPIWFEKMKELAERYRTDRIRTLSFDELVRQIRDLRRWPIGREMTFGIVGGVGQCLQAFNRLLPRWLGEDWRRLFNAAMQGQGTVISAQQILRIVELAHMARQESTITRWFLSEHWDPEDFREQLAGTAFLQAFDRYLHDYGHRAIGESDVMSPRLAEQPKIILALLRVQVGSPRMEAPAQILARQEAGRQEALAEIDRRLGRRWDRRLMFRWWYRRLVRFSSLRESNRHHLMYYSTASRNLLLRLGELLAIDGCLRTAEDIFFVTMEELERLSAKKPYDWKSLVAARRAERARQSTVHVPDTIRDWEEALHGSDGAPVKDENGILHGIAISAGSVIGPIRIVRSAADWSKVQAGDIIVVPVIDPGMAPLFSVAGGVIAEMGGTLSHGAIIAREYGLPTIANVEGAIARLADGQRITMDAGLGTICIEPSQHP